MKLTIYCEGTTDKPILNKIVSGLPYIPKIIPTGGKRGAGEYIKVSQSLVEKTDYYLFFRDRDFDVPINEENILYSEYKKDNKGQEVGEWFYSHRNTIENYLLNPVTFFDFLEKYQGDSQKVNLIQKYALHTQKDVQTLFDETARTLSEYQAVRHALGKMRERTDFGTKWTGKSGVLPKQLDKDFCLNTAWGLIETQKIKAENWTKEALEQHTNDFLRLFSTDDFYDKMDFLIYFQGKDFAKYLTRNLAHFPIENYYDFAAKRFDYTQFPDLVAFRKRLVELQQQ